ncbi:hypothetical protein CLV43_102404 [Umezawaea tangerina]|uniref:Uncharacterized protein n=1 Tax=Umezawaea tangerina TaxID=84725 RepID=A0A2T0TGU0_9PSEU|nr:hypothetical protein CLV43_102404 [Umezawaea tangerina]
MCDGIPVAGCPACAWRPATEPGHEAAAPADGHRAGKESRRMSLPDPGREVLGAEVGRCGES